MNEQTKQQSGIQINLSMQNVLVLIAFILGIPVGGGIIFANATGTPAQTTQEVKVQADTLKNVLTRINTQLVELNEGQKLNTSIIYLNNKRADARMDSLYSLTMDFARNMDGYFKGRLDQLNRP